MTTIYSHLPSPEKPSFEERRQRVADYADSLRAQACAMNQCQNAMLGLTNANEKDYEGDAIFTRPQPYKRWEEAFEATMWSVAEEKDPTVIAERQYQLIMVGAPLLAEKVNVFAILQWDKEADMICETLLPEERNPAQALLVKSTEALQAAQLLSERHRGILSGWEYNSVGIGAQDMASYQRAMDNFEKQIRAHGKLRLAKMQLDRHQYLMQTNEDGSPNIESLALLVRPMEQLQQEQTERDLRMAARMRSPQSMDEARYCMVTMAAYRRECEIVASASRELFVAHVGENRISQRLDVEHFRRSIEKLKLAVNLPERGAGSEPRAGYGR